jgi:serine/threonine protein kinase
MSLDHVHALPLGTQLGDYRLDAVIGHGGFGITYRAFDSQLAKIVAIKEYLPVEFAVRGGDGKVVARGARFADDFAWGRDRFLDEARALARFRHPHIVPVLRFIEANGTAYTVMEFEDGRSVAEMLPQGRRLPAADVRRLAEGLLSGLKAVHAQGFLHRDIKPSNIIIRRDGVPILIDFGAARLAIGGRTRTLTTVLTPQYAPIEQYAIDGKQGPWSDIYSAAAVLHRAVAGEPPPEAAGRVGQDPYRPLARTQADRFEQSFLSAIDRALAFAPEQRPQSIDEWRKLFGSSLPSTVPAATDALTQKIAPSQPAAPRLGGVTRGQEVVPPSPPPPARRLPFGRVISLLVVAIAAVGAWQLRPQIGALMAGGSVRGPAPEPLPTPTPSAPPSLSPVPASTPPQVQPQPQIDHKALIEQAQRAAAEARAIAEKAKETTSAAVSMAGEARIAAAHAARPGLENAERVNGDDGSTYVGQLRDGKREGLGVVDSTEGGRQAGEWKDNVLSGLGVDREADGTRFEGQWRDGRPNGLGVREKAGVERAEGNFASSMLDGMGRRRLFDEPSNVQIGEWHNGALDGPGVETVGDKQRYEGFFHAGKRHGFGRLTGPDEKAISGRWEDGKLVESAP